ncbi:hypothetical protein [Streptococcus danieliae]|uniref:Uncharacterized protein n=1 Tax=Streptococcus danieliae TaxID=747656 RepID=A0A7Z0M7P1_9STRE|nr:hypothetical protein [Streptococcus danieliae]MBF0700158.1 hypothetical protein [Streptococcus danieliae]NYS97334.1 hypothetical protein [Streptococcus danieliae]
MNKTALAIATATILTLPTSVTLAEVTEEVIPIPSTEVVDPSTPVTPEVPGEVILNKNQNLNYNRYYGIHTRSN